MSLPWDDVWMTMAIAIGQRSRCVRSQAGCVLVSFDQRVVSVGYNGPARSWRMDETRGTTCDVWCPRASTGGGLSYDDDVAIHAEANALIRADFLQLEGGAAYVTRMPCFMCAKMLANSSIDRIVAKVNDEDKDRQPERSMEYLHDCGLSVDLIG